LTVCSSYFFLVVVPIRVLNLDVIAQMASSSSGADTRRLVTRAEFDTMLAQLDVVEKLINNAYQTIIDRIWATGDLNDPHFVDACKAYDIAEAAWDAIGNLLDGVRLS